MSVKGFQLDRYLFIVCVIEFMRFQFTEKNRYTLNGISKDYGSILPLCGVCKEEYLGASITGS